MRKVKLLLIVGIAILFAACTYPTMITKSVSVTTNPDGKQTTTVTKSISQSPQIGITKSTDEVVKEFNK